MKTRLFTAAGMGHATMAPPGGRHRGGNAYRSHHSMKWAIMCALVLILHALTAWAAVSPPAEGAFALDDGDDTGGAEVMNALDRQAGDSGNGALADGGGEEGGDLAGAAPLKMAVAAVVNGAHYIADSDPLEPVAEERPAPRRPALGSGAGAGVVGAAAGLRRNEVSVMAYGAISDGSRLCTDAFNNAISELSAMGGGTLRVPAGSYLVTTIYLASGVTLHLDKGATILASTEADDWKPVTYTLSRPQCYGRMGDTKFEQRFFGGPVLFCADCDKVTVTGEGIVDGQGSKWWKNPEDPRGYLAFFLNSTNLHISGLTFQNSAAWNIVPKFCTNVTVDDVKVYNHYVQGHNTDGVNPYGSKNVRITNTVIVTGDDCIAVKSGPRPSCGVPSENIVVYNVTCVGSHGLTIGSEMNAGVRNVHFANITIDGRNTPSSQGVRLKSQRGRGGYVEDILYENIRIHNVKIGIQATLNYRDVDPSLRPIPYFRNITIRNVYGTMIRRTFGSIDGLPDAPIEGIQLENIYMFGDSGTKPLVCKDAVDATFGMVFPPPKVTGSCATRWPVFVTDFLGLHWSGLPRWFSMHLLNWFW